MYGGSGTFNIAVVNDRVVEGPEYLEIRVDRPGGWTHYRTRVYIKDANSRVDLTVDTDSDEDGNQDVLTEGDSVSGVSVSAAFWNATSSSLSSATTVTLSVDEKASPAAGEAGDADVDYAPSTPLTLTIPAPVSPLPATPTDIQKGLKSSNGTLTGLTVIDDTVVEGPETLALGGTLSLASDHAVSGSLTIADDDADIDLEWSRSWVFEQAGTQAVTVTASFKGATSILTEATDVAVTVAGAGGATLATSCTSLTDDACTSLTGNAATISIPMGQTSASRSFTVTARDDSTAESGERLTVSGTASVGGESVTVTSADLPIFDPGRRVVLSFHEAVSGDPVLAGVVEDGGAQTVRVKATAAAAVSSDTTVTVNVGAAGGTAVLGPSGDYTRGGTGTATLTIANGMTVSNTADVEITPAADAVVEGAETIRFTGEASGLWSFRLIWTSLRRSSWC